MSRTPTGTVDGAAAATPRLTAETFAEAFTTHARTLWCIAAGVLAQRDQVDDVLQEGAMIALRKLDQFDPDTSFIAWMGRIVRYVALNQGRRQRRRATVGLDPDTLPITAGPADAAASARGELIADQRAFDDDVLHALRSLEDTARSCVLLRTVLDLPYREIALALDIPEGTAMSHVHRARGALRERLRHRAPPAEASTAKGGGA
jgi:RNA polymerase sigma-70 factor (ECF subfamily)